MDWLPLNEVIRQMAVPDRTVYRYLSRHERHLNTRREGRRIWVHRESLPVLLQLRSWYAQGLDQADVEQMLRDHGCPMFLDAERPTAPPVPVAETLAGMANQLDRLLHLVDMQAREIAALRQEVAGLKALPAPPPPLEPGLSPKAQELLDRIRQRRTG